MGSDSKIAWCHDTLNIWLGCTKISDACTYCYAEHETPVRVHRGRGLELWGPKAARYETKSWRANLRSYEREAMRTGIPRRVFAQSLSDTFEDRPDLVDVRGRFFAAIDELRRPGRVSLWTGRPVDGAASPLHLLLLTKRPENVRRMVPPHWLVTGAPEGSTLGWPKYVWIGTTVENQEMAEKRIPHLLRVPAAVRFLSVEPLLGQVSLSDILEGRYILKPLAGLRWVPRGDGTCIARRDGRISWVIVGGESGHKARPFDLAWARSIVDQCKAAGVPCFVKQLGAKPRETRGCEDTHPHTHWLNLKDSHGGDIAEFPEDLRVRELPTVPA